MLEKTVESRRSHRSPARSQFPRQGEWTYEDWLNFPDDGWKYEIIDGVSYTLAGNYGSADTAGSNQLAGFKIAVASIFNF